MRADAISANREDTMGQKAKERRRPPEERCPVCNLPISQTGGGCAYGRCGMRKE
jgi:hypothetical protein